MTDSSLGCLVVGTTRRWDVLTLGRFGVERCDLLADIIIAFHARMCEKLLSSRFRSA